MIELFLIIFALNFGVAQIIMNKNLSAQIILNKTKVTVISLRIKIKQLFWLEFKEEELS